MLGISNGCKAILRKMLYQEKIGRNGIPIVFPKKWIKHLSREEHNLSIKDLKDCIKEGLILTEKKHSQVHVSLNPKKIQEVHALIKK